MSAYVMEKSGRGRRLGWGLRGERSRRNGHRPWRCCAGDASSGFID